MKTMLQGAESARRKRWGPGAWCAALATIGAAAPLSGATAQASNAPSVQVICQVVGGSARTVRVTYPSTAVKNIHVFFPVAGGANVVIHPTGAASQVYTLAVPAGSYRLRYATQMASGGYPPSLSTYGPVIVIPPFTVARGVCQRSQAVGSPVS